MLLGREYVKADGTVLSPGRPTPVEAYRPADPQLAGISGRYQRTLEQTANQPAEGEPRLPLNAAARAVWDTYDPVLSPIVTCQPMNIPTLFYPAYYFDIRVNEREATLQYELFDVVRRIPLSGEPKEQEGSGSFGVAAGRMEGDTLVIESSGFPASKWGLAIAGLQSGNGGDVPSNSGSSSVYASTNIAPSALIE